MENYIRLSVFSQEVTIDPDKLIMEAIADRLKLSVWFEGLLLKPTSPYDIEDIPESARYKMSDDLLLAIMDRKTAYNHGKRLFRILSIHKNFIELPFGETLKLIPNDEFMEFIATGKATITCVCKDDTLFLCHKIRSQDFDEFWKDSAAREKVCEGKTTNPIYSLNDIFIEEGEAIRFKKQHTGIARNTTISTEGETTPDPIVAIGLDAIEVEMKMSEATFKKYAEIAGIKIDDLKRKTEKGQIAIHLKLSDKKKIQKAYLEYNKKI